MSVVLQVLPREGAPDPEGERLSRVAGGAVRAGWLYRLADMPLEDLGQAAAVLGDPVLHGFAVGEEVPEGWAAALEIPEAAHPEVAGLLREVLGRPAELEAARLYLLGEGADPAAVASWRGAAGTVRRADGAGSPVGSPPSPFRLDEGGEISLDLAGGWQAVARLALVHGHLGDGLARALQDVAGVPLGGVLVLTAREPEDLFPGRAVDALETLVQRGGLPILGGAMRFGREPGLALGRVELRQAPGERARSGEPGLAAPPAPALEALGPPGAAEPAPEDPEAWLLGRLASPDLRSRDVPWRRLDFEGLGNLVVRPVNPRGGPSDGAVVWPFPLQEAGSPEGLAVAVGLAARPGAAAAEARERAVACGGDPDRTAVLVSPVGSEAVALAMAVVPDVRRPATMEPLRPGDRVFLVSEERLLHQAMAEGTLASCHAVGPEGLAVALAEMVLSSGLGLRVQGSRPFAPGGFLVTVPAEEAAAFAARMGEAAREVGDVTVSGRVDFGPGILDVPVARLREAWSA